MTEQDKFEQAFDPEASDRAFLKSIRDGDGYRQFATYLNGAWWGWQAKAKHTGNDPEMGFILEAANEGELAAYDHGCAEAQSWLDSMLNKPLDYVRAGGFSSGKINEQRAAILALREKAERYDWLARQPALLLESATGQWVRNGVHFTPSHRLCAGSTAFAPEETLDATIDCARAVQAAKR